MNKNEIIERSYEYRKLLRVSALEMAKSTGKAGAHLGGSFSAVDIIATLYGGILNYRPEEPDWSGRDRFITSKRHCYLASYSALCLAGMISKEQLYSFHADGGELAGYPWIPELGIDFSGGSLGMGLSAGIGMAIIGKKRGQDYKVYVLLGDGECNEGSIWESFMSAAKFKLDNLIVIIDNNHLQFDGRDTDIMPMGSLEEKAVAFGFETVAANGHSIESLYDAFTVSHNDKPLAIIAETVKGFGLPSIEDKVESHHTVLKEDDYIAMMADIEGGRYDRV